MHIILATYAVWIEEVLFPGFVLERKQTLPFLLLHHHHFSYSLKQSIETHHSFAFLIPSSFSRNQFNNKIKTHKNFLSSAWNCNKKLFDNWKKFYKDKFWNANKFIYIQNILIISRRNASMEKNDIYIPIIRIIFCYQHY